MNPGAVVLSGGLWFAVPIAIAAGLLSFLSPCVLPLVPGYLGYVSGVTSGRERTRSRMLLQRTFKPGWQPRTGLIGAPLLGVVFAVGWTPCVGPTLIAVQSLVLDQGNLGRALIVGLAYCIGLGIPFVLVAIGFGWVGGSVAFVKRHIRAINIAGGVLLIIIGVLMVSGVWRAFITAFGAGLGIANPL
jgi:cytochrome c-type biogenesis protein